MLSTSFVCSSDPRAELPKVPMPLVPQADILVLDGGAHARTCKWCVSNRHVMRSPNQPALTKSHPRLKPAAPCSAYASRKSCARRSPNCSPPRHPDLMRAALWHHRLTSAVSLSSLEPVPEGAQSDRLADRIEIFFFSKETPSAKISLLGTLTYPLGWWLSMTASRGSRKHPAGSTRRRSHGLDL